jgi:hypothetical protein
MELKAEREKEERNNPRFQNEGFWNRLIEINFFVTPDLTRHPDPRSHHFLDSGSLAGMTSRSATIITGLA